jgi:thiol-disulfide isomerase/thioredoxin
MIKPMTQDSPTPLPSPGNSPISVLKKIILPLILIVGIAISALMLVRSQVQEKDGDVASVQLKTGSVLPDLTLQKFPEGEAALSSMGKKVYLINFWATWCEACITEMPSIVALYDKYKSRGFEVLGVNLDEEPAAVVPKALRDLKMTFPIFKDPESEIADQFNVRAIPLTIIIDKDRKILHVESGDRDWMDDEILAKMEEWLK